MMIIIIIIILKITLLFIIIPHAHTCSPNISLRQKSGSKFVKNGAKDFVSATLPAQSTSREPEINQRKILNGEELNCHFEDTENCCWNNAPISSDNDFLWTITAPDFMTKMDFHSKQSPNGKFLSVSGNGAFQSQGRAQFVSCPIECSDLDVDITLKYWLIGDANMKICMRNINLNTNTQLANCVDLPKVHKRNGPTAETTLPAGENFQIVIVASNLKSNATAIIDDIKVVALPCMTSTSSTTTSTSIIDITSPNLMERTTTTTSPVTMATTTESLSSICHAIECNFEQSRKCSYKNMHTGSNKLFRQWEVMRGSFRNALTGIRKAGEGRQYLATYLYPRDVAGVMTQASLDTDYVIRFMIYKSEQNIELMGCCQSLSNCPFSTQKPVQNDYKKWRQEEFMCPKGTSKIIFYGYNIGENEGALGLDNIELLMPKTSWTMGDSQKAC